MALDIYSKNNEGFIDDLGEQILELSTKYKLDSPICESILKNFYESPTLVYGEVIQFRNELLLIKQTYQKSVLLEKKVYASNKNVLDNIIKRIFEFDLITLKINELLRVCVDAIENTGSIYSVSD